MLDGLVLYGSSTTNGFTALSPGQPGWACTRAVSCSGVCSTAHRSNRPDHWDGLMLDRSAVGQLSSLSSRTKWQRLPAGDTVCSVSPAGNRYHFVLLGKDESCPTADLSNIRSSRLSGLFDRWTVEHAPGFRGWLAGMARGGWADKQWPPTPRLHAVCPSCRNVPS